MITKGVTEDNEQQMDQNSRESSQGKQRRGYAARIHLCYLPRSQPRDDG